LQVDQDYNLKKFDVMQTENVRVEAMDASRADLDVYLTADFSEKYTLRSQDDYLDEAVKLKAVDDWIKKMRSRNRKIYLVVGYITYQNAQIGNKRLKGVMIGGVSASIGASIRLRDSPEVCYGTTTCIL
jgi:hypothetical protein